MVAGLDAAYKKLGSTEIGVGVAIALEWGSWRLLGCKVAATEVCVPYIPGLLAFRETLVMAPALSSLIRTVGGVDLIVVDGHGLAHPRRLGIASHIGVAFDIPSIGVAKKKLVGEEIEEEGEVFIVHKGVKVGVVVRSKCGKKLYVSPGHRVGLLEAAQLVREMLLDGLPKPTLEADRVSKAVRSLLGSSRAGGGLRVRECPTLVGRLAGKS